MDRKAKIKEILTKAGKTFIQAFVSSLGVDSFFGVSGASSLKKVALSVLVGAVAAGISAVWNSILEWLVIRIDELEMDDEEETNPECEGIAEETANVNTVEYCDCEEDDLK